MSEQRIQVPVLARVEGEGALDILWRDGAIEQLQLRIYEPPRLFEKLLEGRDCREVADAVARICGICPVAYQMSALHALEAIVGCSPDPWVHAMRRLFYCGEWIESHALHIHLLALPDFLGFHNAADMARTHADAVRRGLRLQALGNDLIRLLGGRSVHPVGACIGGFTRAPTHAEAAALVPRLASACDEAIDLARWCATLDMPAVAQDFTGVALQHPDEYAMNAGRIVSDRGLDIAAEAYETHFAEQQVAHSTALHSLLDGAPYLVGPLARLNLNRAQLHPAARALVDTCGIAWPSRNPFHSLFARAVEIVHAVHEAADILRAYREPMRASAEWTPRAGSACWATEAPRGLLWHRYTLDDNGLVQAARIVPPTSQNQARIEADLRQTVQALGSAISTDTLRQRCETVVRNYDPCISCATHFLRVTVRGVP